MTSPVGGKPQSTQDKYDDIHSKGSTFGSELTEAKIRDIFSVQVKNPFLQALQELDKFALSVIIEIADAIGGVFGHDGQRSKPIYDAIIAQMGPVHTQVNTLGQHLQAMSTEVNERIDTQEGILEETQGHIDTMSSTLEEQRATLAQNQVDLDAAREDTSTAIAQSKSAVELAKSFNENLTKQITTEFNKATSQATAAVDKADTLAQQLADYKAQQQAVIDDAVGKAEQAVADLATLTPKVTDAVEKAGQAVADVSALTPRVSAAQTRADNAYKEAENVRSEVTPKIEEAQTQGQNALAAAGKAIADSEFIAGFADDLLPKDENGRPSWKEGLSALDDSPTPSSFGSERSARMGSSLTFPYFFDTVKGQEVYRLTVWIKRPDTTSSGEFSFHIENENNQRVWVEARLNQGNWTTSRSIYTVIPVGDWQKYILDFRWPLTAGKARPILRLNESNEFYLHDPQVRVISPVDNSVDLAQNAAIKANQDILAQQELINAEQTKFNNFHTQFTQDQIEWNEAVDRSLTTQDTVNKNFDKWTEGATKAVEANTAAIAALNAPESGASLMPANPLTNEPYYLSWAGTRDNISNLTAVPESVGVRQNATEKVRYNAGSNDYVLSKLNKGTVYRWSVWVYSSVAGSDMRFFLRDPVRGVSAKRVTGDQEGVVTNSRYGIWLTNVPKGWSKQSGTIEFDDEADYIYMYAMEWNVNLLNVEQYFAGLDIYPDVPTQASVDKAQNDAISANTEALKALGKKVLGASLVPYKTPSTQEVEDYAAGKLNYDPWADPEYFDAGYFVVNPMRGRVVCANPDQGTKGFKGSYVTVDSSINYRVKFHTYTASSGSMMYIDMYDQNGALAIAETPFSDRGRVAGCIVDGLTLPRGLKEWSGVVKFKPGTTQVRLGTFYWNHDNGTIKTTQEFGGLEIVPDVPTQDDLNLNFTNNFAKIDNELGLIKSTDKSFRDDQIKWNKASTDATTSLQNFQSQQTEINNLLQEQLWTQLDMIEQLDIQTPRVFHRNTTEGNLQTAPNWTVWSTCRYHDSPFILHLTRHQDTRKMYWQAKGRWEGKLKVTTNWTNGATDVMVYDITTDEANAMASRDQSIKLAAAARTYTEEGGAWGTNLRNSTFEIYPTHLGRSVGIRNTTTEWYIDESIMATGGPSMVRHQTALEVRFTNSFYCDKNFYARDTQGKKVYVLANKVVEPMMIRRADLTTGVTYTFYEKPFTSNTW